MTIHYLLVKISTQVLLSPVFKYMLLFLCWVIFSVLLFKLNQLEKLEAAKAARLVCLSFLSLTGSLLLLLGPSGSIFTDIHWALLGPTGLNWAVLGCTGLYWALLSFI